MHKLASFLALPALLLAALSGACGGSDNTASPSSTTERVGPAVITAEGTIWKPKEITADVGETVTWKWEKGLIHDLEINGEKKAKAANEFTYEQTFDEPGKYRYVCTLHSTMTGTLTVT